MLLTPADCFGDCRVFFCAADVSQNVEKGSSSQDPSISCNGKGGSRAGGGEWAAINMVAISAGNLEDLLPYQGRGSSTISESWHEFPLLTCIKASSKQVLVLGSVSGNTKDTNPRKHVRTLVTIHFPRHCHVNSTRPGQFPTIPSVGSSNFTKLQNILHAHQQSQDSRLHFSTSSRNGVTKSVADIADLGFGILGNERTKH